MDKIEKYFEIWDLVVLFPALGVSLLSNYFFNILQPTGEISCNSLFESLRFPHTVFFHFIDKILFLLSFFKKREKKCCFPLGYFLQTPFHYYSSSFFPTGEASFSYIVHYLYHLLNWKLQFRATNKSKTNYT